MGGTRVYVGGIPRDTEERDLIKFFSGFRLGDILMKNTFAFVEFESSRDAEDAIYDMDGAKLLGKRVSVEMARSTPRGRDRDRSKSSKYNADHRSRGRQRGPLRTKHRLIVKNLSSAVSWQSLKDFMRQAGEVTYGDAHRPRRNEGEVDFASRSDLKAAIRLLDGKELNGRKIQLVEDERANRDRSSGSSRSRNSRSLSRGLNRCTSSRSRSRSPSRVRSRRRTRTPSHARSRTHTRSRSRTRSRSHTRSPSLVKSRRRTKSPSRVKSRSYTRSPSRTRSPSHVRSHRGSRSRSGSVKRDRSKSRSSNFSEGSGAHSKKRSRSKSVPCSPGKRSKLVRKTHEPEPENVSPSTVRTARVQESPKSHTPEAENL